jgi:hypothetical protein
MYVTYHPGEGLIATTSKGRPAKIKSDGDLDPEELYRSNLLKGEQKLLLIFLFASDEELRLVMMHPEFFAFDTTFQTNKQKKELFTIAGLDGNNRGFNGGRAFIPSSKQWVFLYLFRYCLPIFWGKDVIERLRLALTDGDPHEYSQFIRAVDVKAIPNAVHGLCYFHMHVQG